MPKKETILTICAHNDDYIIGAGGTLSKYSQEGKNVKTVVMLYGEMSHPHIKGEEITKRRVKESKVSDKILGCSGVTYMDIKEKEAKDKFSKPATLKKLISIIKKNKPTKIFTHSIDDPHPLHRMTYSLANEAIEKSKFKGDVYSFNVWSPINIRKRHLPKMVVDVSQTFKKKIQAFKAHKSQELTYWTLIWNVYAQALISGLNQGCRYAEVFYKIK